MVGRGGESDSASKRTLSAVSSEWEVTERTKTITVYVRKGEADERLLSFNPPPDLPQEELLAHQFGIDGNRAIRSIPQSAPDGTFTARLFAAQREIADWLREHGYGVEFK